MNNTRFYFLIYLLVFADLLAQSDTIITTVKGFEGNDGNTYLVYQTKQTFYNDDVDSTISCNYLYNPDNDINQFIDKGFEKTYYPENYFQYRQINNIEFINNDPNKCIYSVNSLGIDPDSRIIRSDIGETLGLLGFVDDIFISAKNPENIFAISYNWALRSFDGGLTWPSDSSFYINKNIRYLSFSPFNDSTIFGISNNVIYKSVDFGKTFGEVCDLYSIHNGITDWESNVTLYFDCDNQHIYLTVNKTNLNKFSAVKSLLVVSDEKGSKDSWELKSSFKNILTFYSDKFFSGVSFLSVGNLIYKSIDFCSNLTPLIELQHHANGFFNEPASDVIYASLPNGLIQINSDSVKYILKKSIMKSLELYPIQVGNKWFYNEVGISYDIQPHPFNYYYETSITKDKFYQGLHFYYVEKKNFNENGNYNSGMWIELIQHPD